MSFRTFVIANPESGAGQVRREWERIERLLRAQLPEFEAAFTEGPEHATLLAREALKSGWEMIVAVGGDGTLNETINGFFQKADPSELFEIEDGFVRRKSPDDAALINDDAVFGFIPMGTGGDFRRTIGVMGDVAESVKQLNGTDTRPCDVGQLTFVDAAGKLGTRYYLNIASAGLSGLVDKTANGMWKGLGGKASFAIASAIAWLKYSNVDLDVVIDGVEEVSGHFQNVVVANGEYFGGGMWVAPGAEINDGLFQVVLMADMSKSESVRLIRKIYSAGHLDLPSVSRRDAREVAIRTRESGAVLLDMDGEQPGQLPALFEMHAGAINLK